MKLETFSHRGAEGWSVDPLPGLDSERTLVLAFGASELHDAPGPIEELVAAFPGSHVIGCSTAGEISGADVSDGSLAVAVIAFDGTTLRRAQASVESASASHAAGVTLAQALAGDGLRGVLVLSNGHAVNGTELVRGLDETLPADVVVSGGLAGDGDRFERTWVIADGRPASDRVCAVGLYGDRVELGHGSKGGWDIFGPERRVTRSEGNVLHELDGRPALAIYKDYLGDRASGLPATALLFPLALREGGAEERSVVRTVLAVDEASQSMTFAGDIPEGASAQLMRANVDRLIEGAAEAAVATGKGGDGAPVLSIAISCVGRRLVLGERTEEELEATLDVLPAGSQQIGFYSYGEISPYASGRCDLHNQTMTLTTIGER